MERVIVIGIAIIIVVGIGVRLYLNTYNSNDVMINKIRKKLIALDPKYSDIYIREGNASYTVNQKFITLCTRNPATNEYYDENIITYVALHELTHILVDADTDVATYANSDLEYDKEHGPLFIETFKSILSKAISLGLYDPRYKVPDDYCGGKYT